MIQAIYDAIKEIQQPRSRFQLERFVIGQHATPEMQYYQVCLELQDMLHKYEIAKINVKKQQIKIDRLRSDPDELSQLKADEKQLTLNQLETTMYGAEREIVNLVEIWKNFEHKYTRNEIEAAQPEYWKSRLTNNANAMVMSGSGVNYAHLEAMDQAGVLEEFIQEKIEAGNEVRNLES